MIICELADHLFYYYFIFALVGKDRLSTERERACVCVANADWERNATPSYFAFISA